MSGTLSSSKKKANLGFPISAHDTVIPAQGKSIVATDISIAIPEGHYGRVAPRSGLASKHHLDTGAGVIDADYRGPVGVLLFNFSKEDYQGKYIAFMLICMLTDILISQTW